MDPELSQPEGERSETSDISSANERDIPHPSASSTSDQTQRLGGRVFTAENGGFPWRDVTILEDGFPVYFADVSQYTRNTPDMVWHSRDKNGPVIGHAFIHWKRSIKCGIRSEETSMDWVEMQRSGFAKSKSYRFVWDGRSYVLCRSNSGGKSGQYHVVDSGSKEVVAKHEAKFSFRVRRDKTLTFAPGVDVKLQLLIVMGVSAWREKSWRKRNAANRQPY